MHPRNIYKTPVNFNELRKLFPEFAEKVQVDVNGKLKLDFKDQGAVRILTKCCLKKDFNLDIEIPPDKLLPTLPLRLNYILWIEDLLNYCGIKENIVGVDIGTGSCCIYCLLAVRMNVNWKMYGLEIDKENIQYATSNVLRNKLDEEIKIIDQDGNDKIFGKLFTVDDGKKTFTICNPPFFSTREEIFVGENRTGKRRKLDHSEVKDSTETVFNDGGEFGFVSKILTESIELKDQIDIYSTMFGCKKNFQKFLNLLKDKDIDKFSTTELVQGKVYRWAIAWSFTRKIEGFKTNSESIEKTSNVLKHIIQNANIEDAHVKLLEIFKELKITTKCLKSNKNKSYQYELQALNNTWSNQRRKRRAEQRNKTYKNQVNNTGSQSLKMGFQINCLEKNDVNIQIFFVDGTMPKDSVNQILQYIKNKFKT